MMIVKIAKGKRGERGQSSIETAFALLIMLGFFIIIWDGINLGYNWVSMQFVLGRGLRDVQIGKTVSEVDAGIDALAARLAIGEGLTATVAAGDFAWLNSDRPVVHITLQRTVDFGPFLQKILAMTELPTTMTITVQGFAETPPS